mmetsp:Transcript_16777/g.33554  ORF Transcript_16777/g.33554 Transcript_16777/m.33554 type:complete len:171 (+) Transcript_16777:112-624(+)
MMKHNNESKTSDGGETSYRNYHSQERNDFIVHTGMPINSINKNHKVKPDKIDITRLNPEDFENLRKADPFLYYSIPAIKSAELLLRDVDYSNLDKSSIRRNCVSCPSRIESEGSNNSLPQQVKRKSRMSFECHSDLLLDDLFAEDDRSCQDNEEKEEEDFQMLMKAFGTM